MNSKNSIFTKALSVLLTAVMLFGMMAVGIIIPDTAVKTYAAEANSISAVNTAISAANSAGANTVTTIKLTADITAGETAAFTTITGNVLFDFNGYSMTFEYNNTGLGNNNNSNYEQQLPSELQSLYNNGNAQDFVTKGMFNISSGGKMQIINSSSTEGGLSVKTYAYGDDSNGRNNTDRHTTTWGSAASGIYSEGTLILGDKADNAKNNFKIRTQARAGTDNDGYDKRHMTANSYGVTVNGSNAKFYMYGGTIESLATTRTNFHGHSNSRCFSVNINSCYCAEIYGGSLKIPGDDECGVRNSDSNKSEGGTCYFSTLRINTPNVYVFNTNCSVGIHVGDDTDQVNTSTADIYVPNTSALPCIYGGKFENTSTGVNETSAGWDHNYCILGKFSYADGSVKPGTNKAGTFNGTDGWQYVYRAAITTQYFITLFHFGDSATENGLYPWAYDTFRDYVSAVGSSTDVYKSTGAHTYINDGSAHATDTNRNYRRNGWHYDYWMGSKMPGNDGETRYDNLGAAGLNASSGGSLFMFPAWLLTNYTITYDLNDGTGLGTASNASGAPGSYNIKSTVSLPTPTRNGYTFGGWELTAKSYPATDTADPWYVGNTYAAAMSLNGKNGNISLKALWTEIIYTSTFNKDNIPAGATGTAETATTDYNINSTFSFPSGCTKNYYTFNNKWLVTTAAGNWDANTEYNAGSTSPAGKYGSPTFTAQYTPVNYTITYISAGGTDCPALTYNYESTNALPSPTRTGYTFAGWKPQDVSGSWDSSNTYTNFSLSHCHGSVTLVAQWTTVSSTITLNIGTGESFTGSLTQTYNFFSSVDQTVSLPSKTGYDFAGWKVTGVPAYSTEPEENRWIQNTVYTVSGENNYVIIPGGKIGDVTLSPTWTKKTYRITYNTNGGSAINPLDYDIESTFSLSTPSRNGYTFQNWSVSEHDTEYSWTASTYAGGAAISGAYGSITLYANYTETQTPLTLDVNGGDALVNPPATFTYTAGAALPRPTRTGYDFDCWKVTAAAAGSNFTVGDEFTDAIPINKYGSVTLQAQWTPVEYTITLVSDGTNGGSKNYNIESASFTLGASTLAGYNFVNWKVTGASGSWALNETYASNAVISGKYGSPVLRAQFTPKAYTITYLDRSGSQIGTAQNYNIETENLVIRGYSENGYTFGSWVVESASDSNLSAGAVIYAGEQENAGAFYGDLVLTPECTPVEYTATFDSDGGDYCQPVTFTVESTNELPAPAKTGYNFAGWKVTSETAGSWTKNSVKTDYSFSGDWGNVTFTAQWTAKPFTVKFVTPLYPAGIAVTGYYNDRASDATISAAQKAKAADAQYTYTFAGWSLTENGEALTELPVITEDLTLYAVYTAVVNTYTVTWKYHADETSAVSVAGSDVLDYGAVPAYTGAELEKTSSNPTHHEWSFAGWSLTDGGAVLAAIPAVTGNAVYYAVFEEVLSPKPVTWVINGASYTVKYGVGTVPACPYSTDKPDADGYKYTFAGWSETAAGSVLGTLHTIEENAAGYTYYAQYIREEQTYTLSFRANGGTLGTAALTYTMSDIITFPVPVRTAYDFAGWKVTTAAGTWEADDTVYAGNDSGHYNKYGNAEFTAQWTPAHYTVSFSAVSATDVLPEAIGYTTEDSVTVPAATREGYVLTGWIVSAAGGSWVQGAALSAPLSFSGEYGNVTLSPQWRPQTYTISWISGDVTETDEVMFGDSILVRTPYSKSGYTAEWDSEIPESMPAENITFTAVYTPVDYTLRLNLNGGVLDGDTAVIIRSYNIESTDTLPAPTRDGASFTGWRVTTAAGKWIKNSILPAGTSLTGKTGNVTLTAQWERFTCTVTWVYGGSSSTSRWYYGAVPSFDGTPYKAPDERNSYVFRGWSATENGEIITEFPELTADVTYYAIFDATEREYTVTWNIDGNTRVETGYSYGDTPVYPGATPERAATSEYIFTFSGWSPDPAVTTVTKDLTFIAQFDTFVKIQSLSLDAGSKILSIGDTAQFVATVSPRTATVKDVIWASSDTSVAAIASDGTVTAVNNGLAVITASSADGQFRTYAVVSVGGRHTNYIEITANGVSATNLAGAEVQLYATLQPENATNRNIRWSSSNLSVASVDQNGLVSYNNPGTAVITAEAADGYCRASIEVTCTRNAEEVENEQGVYMVTFVSGKFYNERNEKIKAMYYYFPEGSSLTFKVPKGNCAIINGIAETPDESDGTYNTYRISSIGKNYSILSAPEQISDATEEIPEESASSFLARIQAFFRKIVLFFRNLFGKK